MQIHPLWIAISIDTQTTLEPVDFFRDIYLSPLFIINPILLPPCMHSASLFHRIRPLLFMSIIVFQFFLVLRMHIFPFSPPFLYSYVTQYSYIPHLSFDHPSMGLFVCITSTPCGFGQLNCCHIWVTDLWFWINVGLRLSRLVKTNSITF